MTNGIAEAYLASTEGYGLEQPRKCFFIKYLKGPMDREYLLARIIPPIMGQYYGLGARDIDCVILSSRHAGFRLSRITAWPAYVHVARPLIADIEDRDSILQSEYEVIAWAELYETEGKAREALSL